MTTGRNRVNEVWQAVDKGQREEFYERIQADYISSQVVDAAIAVLRAAAEPEAEALPSCHVASCIYGGSCSQCEGECLTCRGTRGVRDALDGVQPCPRCQP